VKLCIAVKPALLRSRLINPTICRSVLTSILAIIYKKMNKKNRDKEASIPPVMRMIAVLVNS
jgi:hypothetical protein